MNDISILPIDAINTAIGNAIAFVLWNSALSVEGSRKIQVVAFTRDGLDSTTFEDFESLSAHCKIHLIEKASSILLLLYSLVFTRGVSTIRDEMREENILVSLVGAHGNCTQSLLNLAVIGKAVPDVLDGCNALFQMEGPSSKTIIGLLSHAESVDSKVIRVGSFFKDPFMPIWIISGESHTSMLFSTNSDSMNREFVNGGPKELFFWNGLHGGCLTRIQLLDAEQTLLGKAIALSLTDQKYGIDAIAPSLSIQTVQQPFFIQGRWKAGTKNADDATADLLLIIKTRWPSVASIIFPDHDGSPPSMN
jgi:hypothetical protein